MVMLSTLSFMDVEEQQKRDMPRIRIAEGHKVDVRGRGGGVGGGLQITPSLFG